MKTISSPLVGTMLHNRLLRPGQFVPAALECAVRRPLSIEELEDHDRLRRLYAARFNLKRTLGKTLPLEKTYRAAVGHHLERVTTMINRFELEPEFGLPTMDPSFLSWKTQEGFPGFAVFKLDTDTCSISLRRNELFDLTSLTLGQAADRQIQRGSIIMAPELPGCMKDVYLDPALKTTLDAVGAARNASEVKITAHYDGAMPESVRDNIHAWLDRGPRESRFDHIFIVADCPDEKWELTAIPKADPLVIGVTRSLIFLIDAYDLTPVEKAAMDLCVRSMKSHN